MRQPSENARHTFIKVRVSKSEREAFANRARELSTTSSDLIRQAAFGELTVRSLDSDAAFELRRIGAMLKHLYPKQANWTNEEKRRYWEAMDTLIGFAESLAQNPAATVLPAKKPDA